MAGIYPLSRIQQLDKDTGKALSGGKLYLFSAGTDIPLNAYKDFGLSVLHPFPIPCDSAGRLPMIFLADGAYKHRLTNKNGVVQFADDSVPVTGPSSGGGGGGTSVDPNALLITRDIKVRFDDQPLAGYVRLNGRTIGSATSGATERANADTQSLFTELWPFSNIALVGGKGGSAAADWAANKGLTLPDCAGRLIGGRDDMGNGAQSRITSVNAGVDPTVVGAVAGEEKHRLSKTELPVLGLTANVTDPGHNHALVNATLVVHPMSGNDGGTGTGLGHNDITVSNAPTGITVAIPEVGGGNPHNNLPPFALFTIYIKL
jgi:microcystin-dependent protein